MKLLFDYVIGIASVSQLFVVVDCMILHTSSLVVGLNSFSFDLSLGSCDG